VAAFRRFRAARCERQADGDDAAVKTDLWSEGENESRSHLIETCPLSSGHRQPDGIAYHFAEDSNLCCTPLDRLSCQLMSCEDKVVTRLVAYAGTFQPAVQRRPEAAQLTRFPFDSGHESRIRRYLSVHRASG